VPEEGLAALAIVKKFPPVVLLIANPFNVPTLVKLLLTTVEFKVVPVSVSAAAVTVPLLFNVILVPLTVIVVGIVGLLDKSV
jgi:hypothetical protein